MNAGSMVFRTLAFSAIATVVAAQASRPAGEPSVSRATSIDGVEIVYRMRGDQEPTLVFIHGGFADWTFWTNQIEAFSAHTRVIAVDLAGHGESGTNRKRWDVPSFAQDVKAVMEKEAVRQAVVIGNSLGGPVAMEVAKLLPDRVTGIVGVDTFQDLGDSMPAEEARNRADVFRRDYQGTLKQMIKALFHKDVDPVFFDRIERRMLKNGTPEMAVSLMESYATTFEWARIPHPIRCINGDLFPTDIAKCRRFHPDFDAVVLNHMGHYPMLENPNLFNQHLAKIVEELTRRRIRP